MALYNFGVALEARRWHIADYEAVLLGIRAEHVQASCCCLITAWLALRRCGCVQLCQLCSWQQQARRDIHQCGETPGIVAASCPLDTSLRPDWPCLPVSERKKEYGRGVG